MSKPIRLILAIALAVFAGSAVAHADSPLEAKMEKMKRAFRGLRTALEAPVDADKDKYVSLAEDLRAASVASKEYEPEKTDEIPADKRAEFLAGYRQSMDDLIALIDQLKTQLAAGDWEAARAQVKLINQSQRDGHKEFRGEHD